MLTLSVFVEMLKSLTVHKDVMRRAAEDGFITATDLADYLVRKGMPFRRAHEIVGRAVLLATEQGCGLGTLPLGEYRKLSPLIRKDVYDALSLEASVNRRTSYGGTAPSNLKRRLQALKKKMQ
jgi:argininosuccinate lyase